MTNLINMLQFEVSRSPVKARRRLIYSLSCILLALLTTLAIVLNGADCLSNAYGDNPLLVKSPATNHSSYKRGKDSFKEVFSKLTIQVKENTPLGSKLADIQVDDQSPHRIMYAIVGGLDPENFTVRGEGRTVELFSEVEFDYESDKKAFNILIRATSVFLRHDVEVDILVTDDNDNKPKLEDFAIVFNNYKNNFPTGPIGRVPAYDADVHDQLRYRVLAGNNAQLVVVNETSGDIQLSPWLNSNVPMKAVIVVAVSDGLHEAVAHLVLTVNLVTETMLQNSIVLRLDGLSREEFLNKKYESFLTNIAQILGTNGLYGTSNIVVFDVEESLQPQETTSQHEIITYRPNYRSSSTLNSNLSVNVSFSARADGNDVEAYLSSQHIEERVYLNRAHLSEALGVSVAPFQDNLCVQEPCQNYQECQAIYKFEKAPKTFITTRNIIFRPIRAVQSFACSCPPTFTGMKHKADCNLQVNQCFSNPCLNGGICHRHESGYSCECKPEFVGRRCEHSFANSTCQSLTSGVLGITTAGYQSSFIDDNLALPSAAKRSGNMCGGKSRCVNLNKTQFYLGKPTGQISGPSGGFSCQGCPHPQWSTDLCELRARSFNKNSYVTLPSLRRRHRFHITLQFATTQNDALIFYNGRYNDKHDFIALEIVDTYLKFSYSLGSTVTSLTLSTVPVSNGNWHKVAIDYRERNVTLLVDDCDPVIDETLAKIQGPNSKRCSNTSYAFEATSGSSQSPIEYRMLDLSSPMQLGALPSLPTEFQISTLNSFVGCMSDIYIDHQLVDLYNPIQDFGTQPGCLEKRSYCQQQSCNGHSCQDFWGAPKCACGDDYLGKSCETLISNEKVRRFSGNSYLTFNPIDSTIANTWQISLHFRTINPNGLLMKVAIDTESNILLELFNAGLKLNYRSRNITFNKISLDDGEWHFVEVIWSPDFTQIQLDYNPNLSVQSTEMGSISGLVMKTVTVGAAPNRQSNSDASVVGTNSDAPDFTSSVANLPPDDFASMYTFGNNSSQSFAGCIYGVNISDNTELWISNGDERNVERGCQAADVCETNSCPPNSRCIRKGMNQRKCVCNAGFVGERCVPVCDLNPCQGENSRCLPVTGPITTTTTSSSGSDNANSAADIMPAATGNTASYRCECEPHRIGKNCEHQLSPRCPSNWWGRPLAGANSSICGPCNCDETKGFDGDCDKTTGQCFCKSNHYQPIGSEYCLACDCYNIGSLSASCNQTTGQCKCRPGVVGTKCDTCASSWAEVTRRGCEVIYDACPKTFSDGIWWDKTEYGKSASQPCPASTSTGTATRYCHKAEGWQKPNLFDCISNTFTDLLNQYKFFEDNNVAIATSFVMKTANNLRLALNETISNPATQLYGSDMYISFRLIHHLIQHESRQTGLNLTHRQDRLYIRNIAESINYILDPAYAENWPEISARSPNGGAEHLLKLIDTYGKVLIESQSDTFTQPFEVSTKYFTFGMDTLSADQLWDLGKNPSINNAPTSNSPPYATDPFGPIPTGNNAIDTGAGSSFDSQAHFNNDGSSVYLDYTLTGRDSSPAILIPKYDNYASSDGSNMPDTSRALIPLKTLRIQAPPETISSPNSNYYPTKPISRAKRDEFVISNFKMLRQPPALVAYSIYRSLGPLLPNNSDNTVQHRLGMVALANSPVIWLTLRPVNSSEFLNKNVQPKINYMLKMVEPTGKTRPQCAVWEFSPQSVSTSKNQTSYGIKHTGKFTTKGCEIKGIHPNHRLRFKYDYVNCSCDHLGAVTVLMDSANYDYLIGEETNMKDTALVTALSMSLAILIAIYIILSFVRGHSIKSNSNSINKNLVFLLIAMESLFLYTVLSKSVLNQLEYQCKLVAIFLHYFSICIFFWLLVNAIHFYRMLTELRDINHGPMKFYHVLGYAVPAFFVSIAVGLRIENFGNYLFCWLSIYEPIIWSMFGPIMFVSAITIMLFLLAFCKSLPVKEDPNGANLLRDHMLINIIKTPMIGIYWLVAVYVFNEALPDYVYLFPALTVLKSIALFVLLCILDKHIRYNLYVSWLRFKGEKMTFIDESMNYSSSQWMPNMMAGEMMPGALNKQHHYPYAGYHGPATTPGFQSSCTDIFRPEVLAFSAASTTSRSTATGTSSGIYHYQQHRTKTRHGRRKHKKSHHKHHHHRHHHHHHHHRSHRHRYNENIDHSQNDLASSHSSDRDDVSTMPKTNQNMEAPVATVTALATTTMSTNDTNSSQQQVDHLRAFEMEEQQTVPMELSAAAAAAAAATAGPSTSGMQTTKIFGDPTEPNQSNA